MASSLHPPFAAGHPAPHRHRVGAARLLLTLCMAPVAWSVLELTAYGLASHACFPGYEPRMTLAWSWLQPLLLGVGMLALVVGLAGLTASWRSLRRTADEHRGATGELLEVGEGRTRFLAIWGVLAGGAFSTAILFELMALLLVPVCAP